MTTNLRLIMNGLLFALVLNLGYMIVLAPKGQHYLAHVVMGLLVGSALTFMHKIMGNYWTTMIMVGLSLILWTFLR